MEAFKLTPSRAAWIAILCLAALVAPRMTEKPPSPVLTVTARRISGLPGLTRQTDWDDGAASALKPEDDLFTSPALPRIRIEISRSQMSILENYTWRGWGGRENPERQDAKSTVYEGGRVYTNVAIHLKGSAGSFRGVHDKPALTLNFDKFAQGQRFHGLKKIHLNNSVQDPSYLSEQISRELCLAAGVPTTRATQATVRLNDRDRGIYVLVEGWNRQFLKRHFSGGDGTLYDGGFVSDVTRDNPPPAIMSGDETNDRSDLRKLVKTAGDPDIRQRLARLDTVLDVDRFLSFLAMEVILVHTDGYSMNVNNYRIYHDPESDKFFFMPHGMDQMFGSFRTGPDLPITSATRGLIARSVLQTPDGRARYLDRVGVLYTNVFKTDAILSRIDELSARLRPYLSEGGMWDPAIHQQSVAQLRQRIVRRGKSIQEQLAARSVPLEFNQAGEARPGGWKSRVKGGEGILIRTDDDTGRKLLRIQPKNGYASWRARALLEPGRYQFTGKVKITGYAPIPNDPRSGVGLRLSGDPELKNRLLKDTDWREAVFDFEITAVADVELVCEARGQHGEILFDTDSLRIVRLPLAAK
jgi:hypothetical protein